MSKQAVIDSNVLVALVDNRDKWHKKARVLHLHTDEHGWNLTIDDRRWTIDDSLSMVHGPSSIVTSVCQPPTDHWSLATAHWSPVTDHQFLPETRAWGTMDLLKKRWPPATDHWPLITDHWPLLTGHFANRQPQTGVEKWSSGRIGGYEPDSARTAQ